MRDVGKVLALGIVVKYFTA
jgi:hypothetical protein